MNLFDQLFIVSDTSISLDKFLCDNMSLVNDFNNSTFLENSNYIESGEKYILSKIAIIDNLDFSKTYNKAFVSILFDFFERYGCTSALQCTYNTLVQNKIVIGHRLSAATLYLFNIDCATTLVNRFESICQLLQIAIEFEEDDDKKIVATFSNYYSYVLNNLNPRFIIQLRDKIIAAIESDKYHFLKSNLISELISIETSDINKAFIQIQTRIDEILGKSIIEFPKFESQELSFVIENNSDYSATLSLTSKGYKSIRAISVNKFNEIVNQDDVYHSLGRGVAILKDDAQMYSYMRSFGNTHHAKMLSALKKIPFKEIKNDVEIIDWGCGQAIATMVYLEYLHQEKLKINNRLITLIEPSEVCIRRAALHTKHFNNNIEIKTICKDLDSLDKGDFKTYSNNTKIHFFSNILDVDNFSLLNLIELIEISQKGINYFICVSPYITEAKMDRVDGFKRYFENRYKTFELLSTRTNGGRQEDEYWSCNKKYIDCMCPDHPFHCNGKNKWTRVTRVFKVIL